jgi:hypothetical protein
VRLGKEWMLMILIKKQLLWKLFIYWYMYLMSFFHKKKCHKMFGPPLCHFLLAPNFFFGPACPHFRHCIPLCWGFETIPNFRIFMFTSFSYHWLWLLQAQSPACIWHATINFQTHVTRSSKCL